MVLFVAYDQEREDKMTKKKDVKKKGAAKKSIVSKVKEKLSKAITTTDPKEFAELLKQGYKIVDIKSEIKGDYRGATVPKTYILKK